MKTAEEIANEVFDPRRDCVTRVDLVHLLRAYGAQVREEAAKIVDNTILSSREEMAVAIRKMELP